MRTSHTRCSIVLCIAGTLASILTLRAAEPQRTPVPTLAEQPFIGAPEPKKSGKASPLTPEEERAAFTLPPGFEIELVASEDMEARIGKFVAVDWDLHGNLWTMTALEYPVDANESSAVARELYASTAKDKVVVYDRDSNSPTGYSSKPRVFADGLAIPLGILPYKNGAYVQHGPDIVFLSDTDGDGRADKREVILSGFGVQDSHLFPHQFTRAPGGWIWMAQGAFNYGKVRTIRGREVQFDQTRMAKFRYDGSEFEITSQGPCNIWGLCMTMEGETWIQEANDYGYPTMPFQEYANYPGCSGGQWKSYAPEFPGTAPDFRMGGTGLSGLAMSDSFRSSRGNETQTSSTEKQSLLTSAATKTSWPAAYCDVMYVANPIIGRIQAIKIHRDEPRYRLEKLPDFVQSGDEWFRPVALRLGPDGCLYFVDWYNKIISHNEVPRNHPERDKTRGRIWRVKHKDAKPLSVPDFMKLSGDELLAKLGGENTTQSHLAWQAITDRNLIELAPKLRRIVRDPGQTAARRIASLWALEGLDEDQRSRADASWLDLLLPLLQDTNRNIRREALRVLAMHPLPISGERHQWSSLFDALDRVAGDMDPEVRAEVIKTASGMRSIFPLSSDSRTAALDEERALPLLLKMAQPSPSGPTAKSTHNSKVIKVDEAYEREFERYLIRMFLERQPAGVSQFLDSNAAQSSPAENRVLFALALEPRTSAQRVAKLMPELQRPPGDEELLRLAQFPSEPGVADALRSVLRKSETSTSTIESLLRVRTRVDAEKLAPLLADSARELLISAESLSVERGARLASSFQLAGIEIELVRVLERGSVATPGTAEIALKPESLAALRALRDLKTGPVDLFAKLAEKGERAVQEASIAALAVSREPQGPQLLVSLAPSLPAAPRHTALSALASTKPGASALVKGLRSSSIDRDDLDAAMLDKLHAALGDDPDLATLVQQMTAFFRPALRLDGKGASYIDSNIELAGPFTVETWVKLDPDISNRDGILAAPGSADFNFANGVFRIWCGDGIGDRLIAKKKMVPDVWTHLAIARDSAGVFRLYWNGELDTTDTRGVTNTFSGLDVGRTIPSDGGTAGWLAEFRVWNSARTPEEIRADFDRSYETPNAGPDAPSAAKDGRPPGLVHIFTGTNWGKLHGSAKVQKTSEFPSLLTTAEARAQAEKFSTFRALATKAGDADRGKTLFTTTCMVCHSVGGQGAQIGPVLNGAGALGAEALLRNILTPNAAMEAGYRVFRVQRRDGEVLDGLRVSEDQDAIVLRRPNVEDIRILQRDIRKGAFTKTSMMPEGLLEALNPEEVTDLFAYLRTLK